MLRGWFPFYRTSISLGLRSFAAGRFTRQALLAAVSLARSGAQVTSVDLLA